MLRRRARVEGADGEALRRVRELVAGGEGDPLAPFALRPDKRFVFAPDGGAAIGYRVRLRTAVAAGDPVGDPESWPAAIDAFVAAARRDRLRIAVLGAGERACSLWRRHRLTAIPIGRDVVVRTADFSLQGRGLRNLRQAIQRTRNCGVRVDIAREADLPAVDRAGVQALTTAARRGDTRGFSMILGHPFDGQAPDAVLAIARDGAGRTVCVHRYLWAGRRDLSLDVPIRSPRTPNGVDERLVAEIVGWGREHGVERVSLAFAPFPDLYERRSLPGRTGAVLRRVSHVLDPWIGAERLYCYLRKYHAFDQQRYVMLRRRDLAVVAPALMLLEFGR